MSIGVLGYREEAYARGFYGFLPPGGLTPTYPTNHAVYFASTAIRLKWGLIPNANAYQLQVCERPDFSGTLMVNQTLLTEHQHDFTDTGTNDGKRWWRWRYSLDGGTTYSAWSEVGSYWMNTAGAENVNLSINTWALINPTLVTDRHVLPDFPMYAIRQGHIFRGRERNRLGTLISDFVTLKGAVQLQFTETAYVRPEGFFELRRFNEEVKTFFLATFKSSSLRTPTPNIWKMQFETDPELSMFVAGRQDLYVGTLDLTEV